MTLLELFALLRRRLALVIALPVACAAHRFQPCRTFAPLCPRQAFKWFFRRSSARKSRTLLSIQAGGRSSPRSQRETIPAGILKRLPISEAENPAARHSAIIRFIILVFLQNLRQSPPCHAIIINICKGFCQSRKSPPAHLQYVKHVVQ